MGVRSALIHGMFMVALFAHLERNLGRPDRSGSSVIIPKSFHTKVSITLGYLELLP